MERGIIRKGDESEFVGHNRSFKSVVTGEWKKRQRLQMQIVSPDSLMSMQMMWIMCHEGLWADVLNLERSHSSGGPTVAKNVWRGDDCTFVNISAYANVVWKEWRACLLTKSKTIFECIRVLRCHSSPPKHKIKNISLGRMVSCRNYGKGPYTFCWFSLLIYHLSAHIRNNVVSGLQYFIHWWNWEKICVLCYVRRWWASYVKMLLRTSLVLMCPKLFNSQEFHLALRPVGFRYWDVPQVSGSGRGGR